MSSHRVLGLDFGTTNSALALAYPGSGGIGKVELARFALPDGSGDTSTFRSVLFVDEEDDNPLANIAAGPQAIHRYLSQGSGRFIQSLKSYAASSLFLGTAIGGRLLPLEALVGVFLRLMRAEAERTLGPLGRRVVLGRPVRYVNARAPGDEELALTRMRAALALAGFDEVTFEYEPVAAAHAYEQRLDHDALVLIADFGGGTSDFTLAQIGPSRRKGNAGLMLTEGIPLAGDALDAEVVQNAISPALGLGSLYKPPFQKDWIEVPRWLYRKLRKWHHLSFLRAPKTQNTLNDLRHAARDPEKIAALIGLIEEDRGFDMYRAVETLKHSLTAKAEAKLKFEAEPITLDRVTSREDFDRWTAPVLERISKGIDAVLSRAGVVEKDVDRVFLTGGTSLVPAVQALFGSRFGAGKVGGGEELTSVATGLALRARELV